MDVFDIVGNIGLTLLRVGEFTLFVSGFYLLFKNGKIQKTIYWNIIKFAIGFVFIAALIKILHLKFANELFILSFMGIGLTYLLYFLRKSQKQISDFLKVIWVLTALGSSLSVINHWMYRDELQTISAVFFIASVIAFILSEKKKESIME
jgi:uncharacterized membrane protein